MRASCLSEEIHQVETRKLNEALETVKKILPSGPEGILELMAGCGCNAPTLRGAFPGAKITIVDGTKAMIEAAVRAG